MTNQIKNRKWVLASRPSGMISEANFALEEEILPAIDLAAGQFLAKTVMFSFEPAMRGWVDDVPSYLPPVKIGEPMRAAAVARVIQSDNPAFPEGSYIRGLIGWQEYYVGGVNDSPTIRRLPEGQTPEAAFGVIGGSGLTAYFGLMDVGAPKAGETVVVSAAAGSVGAIAAQIARIKGCHVIGIAGGSKKCQWLRDVAKLDGVIDYKNEDVAKRLGELCPNGINVYFDNVGGAILEAVIDHIADFGRIALCGAISTYNDATPAAGPRNMFNLITRRVRMQGFITFDFQSRYAEAEADLKKWIESGEIALMTDIQSGFENIPATLLRLFRGENQGKQLLALE